MNSAQTDSFQSHSSALDDSLVTEEIKSSSLDRSEDSKIDINGKFLKCLNHINIEQRPELGNRFNITPEPVQPVMSNFLKV